MSTANMNLMSGQSEGGNSGGLPEAVIFDMDGTLVATTEADFKAWQRLFLEYGRDLTFPDYFPLLGRKSQDVVEQILGLQGQVAQHAMARKMELFEDIVNLNGIQTLPNVESFLSSLNQAGIPLALATSSRKMKMQLVMEESGLARYFTAFVTGEEV
jgi:beta-phosphoglucomutase-like phosphatase (HAD superfamily)